MSITLLCYLVLREQILQDPVTMEKWSHLVPSRTQKLSTSSASIAMCMHSESSTLPVKDLYDVEVFLLFIYMDRSICISAVFFHELPGFLTSQWPDLVGMGADRT